MGFDIASSFKYCKLDSNSRFILDLNDHYPTSIKFNATSLQVPNSAILECAIEDKGRLYYDRAKPPAMDILVDRTK